MASGLNREDRVSTGVDVDFDDDAGHLQLNCDAESFAELRQRVAEQVETGDVAMDRVTSITLIRIPADGSGTPAPPARRQRWLAIGCFVVAGLVVAAAGIGVATVFHWITSGP